MKIIYLDIDGVLNCETGYRSGECKYQEWPDTNREDGKNYHQRFYSKSKDLLNELIRRTDAKIVISSTWRHSGLEFMKNVWTQENMEGEIIGITPSFRGDIEGYTIPRGCEIEYHLENVMKFHHINWSKERQQEYIEKSEVDNYIIIDDDSDMLYSQRNHFVHVLPSPRNKDGFNEKYFEEALKKLSKTVIDLNY
jgi:hypothetical protein